MLAPADLFAMENLVHAGLFEGLEYVWEALDQIKPYTAGLVGQEGATGAMLREFGEIIPKTLVIHGGQVYTVGFKLLGGDPTKGQMQVAIGGKVVTDATVVHGGVYIMSDDIHLSPGVKVEPGAYIKGPTVIGPGTEVRQGAYLRGSCLIGAGCVVGHTTEVKNSVMLDGAKAGHFAYLGDSILGREVNLGAGTKLANLKIIESPYRIKAGDQTHVIERRKFGAIMGDHAETGCNSVTNPGTILGKRSMVLPCVSVHAGFYPAKKIIRCKTCYQEVASLL
jgi:hypothetical protein